MGEYNTVVCLPYSQPEDDECYEITVRDKYGDGVCCGQGRGHYIGWEGNKKKEVFAGGWAANESRDDFKEKTHKICVKTQQDSNPGRSDDDLEECSNKKGGGVKWERKGKIEKWTC